MTNAIPLIDISRFLQGGEAERRALVREVGAACEELGFLLVCGHAVPYSLVEDMRRVSTAFFDLPLEEKLLYRMPPDRYRGYIAYGNEALAYSLDEKTPPDLKESFSIGPVDVPDDAYHRAATPANFFAPNMWPDRLIAFRTAWTDYYLGMEELAATLMRIFALALGMDEHFFDDKIDRHITNFSVLHYPPQREAPLPGQLRAGAHTDYGSLTIVKPDGAAGGLQVLGKDGTWLDVPHVADAFVVNLGDLMAEWTNDRWVSTLHRVANPPATAGAAARRLSMAFFHQPNYDAVIQCLPTCTTAERPARYGSTTSGEHVWMKINKHRAPEGAAKG
ncbi:MAG: isopenicillin N synthase family oxygenase [Alphaproteobacteria bacterium]|nr:isopenicillin N synthase family oxygenase [Alphaproteobacteria bacterium]